MRDRQPSFRPGPNPGRRSRERGGDAFQVPDESIGNSLAHEGKRIFPASLLEAFDRITEQSLPDVVMQYSCKLGMSEREFRRDQSRRSNHHCSTIGHIPQRIEARHNHGNQRFPRFESDVHPDPAFPPIWCRTNHFTWMGNPSNDLVARFVQLGVRQEHLSKTKGAPTALGRCCVERYNPHC
jgi:hypothetical protein